jgi:hypothetical protein
MPKGSWFACAAAETASSHARQDSSSSWSCNMYTGLLRCVCKLVFFLL